MSSTSAVGIPTPFPSSVSSNVPSLPSVLPSYTLPSFSLGVESVSLLTSVTTSPTAPVKSTFSEQSQLSSASHTTMTVTTMATAATLTSANPSVPSTVSPTSASVSSTSSSAPSAATIFSSSGNQSSTSTPKSSLQPTTTLTTSALSTAQSSTPTSSSLASFSLGTISSSTLMPAATSTSNTPSAITSSFVSSDPSSQSSSPVGTDIPLTTVLESTTTIFITSTNSQGKMMTSVPPVVTEVITTTGSGGIATTVTQAIVNPTLAPNNSTATGSSFFADTGAVTGVFVVVGLASASIVMWILFAIRRRQRMRGIEQDTAVEAAVAAAGLNRAPLDDDEEDGSPISPNTYHQFSSGMGQRSTPLSHGSDSLPTSARLSQVLEDPARDSANSHLAEHHLSSHPEGYVPARTTSPSPRAEQCTDDLGSSRDRKSSYGHTPTYSAGSFEPLLANYGQNVSDQDTSALTMEPPRNRSSRHLSSGLGPNGYSSDGNPESGSRKTSLKRQSSSVSSVPRDEEGYAPNVLMVRNVPDNQSQHSLQ